MPASRSCLPAYAGGPPCAHWRHVSVRSRGCSRQTLGWRPSWAVFAALLGWMLGKGIDFDVIVPGAALIALLASAISFGTNRCL